MSKILFFFFILFILISTLQKNTFALSQSNSFPFPDNPEPLSPSSIKDRDDNNGYLEKNSHKTSLDLFHKFSSYERSILDYISTTELDSEYQFVDRDPDLFSSILESLTYFEHKDQETRKDMFISFEKQLDKESKTRILQSHVDFVEENIEGEMILENNGEGDFENGETETPSGETEGGEDEIGTPGETDQSQEGSWLDGEVCFEAISSEEISIVEGQQRRKESNEYDTERRLSLINIDISININIEKIPQQESEEEIEEPEVINATITAINPGAQNCQNERICRETFIPRLGKKCLCRQIVVCSF